MVIAVPSGIGCCPVCVILAFLVRERGRQVSVVFSTLAALGTVAQHNLVSVAICSCCAVGAPRSAVGCSVRI